MNNAKKALATVLAFAALLALIAIALQGANPLRAATAPFKPGSTEALFGRWQTRTVAEDNINGAYSGQIHFGRDFYEISNDVVATPIRIDSVSYRLSNGRIQLAVAGSSNAPTVIHMLRADRATIALPGNNTLYMYKSTP